MSFLSGPRPPICFAFVSIAISTFCLGETAVALDIKPDCNERPLKIEELIAIADKPETKNRRSILERDSKGLSSDFYVCTGDQQSATPKAKTTEASKS